MSGYEKMARRVRALESAMDKGVTFAGSARDVGTFDVEAACVAKVERPASPPKPKSKPKAKATKDPWFHSEPGG